MTAALEYCSEIWAKRFFWMSLVKVDLRRRYRRSWLGIGWSLMNPIAMTVVLCVVFSRLFGQDVASYAPYVLSGLAFWSFVTGIATDGCYCFYHGENYIRQSPAPLAIYPLRVTLGGAIHFGAALLVLMALVWGTSGPGNILVLWTLVPTAVILFVFAWSVAVCLGVANVLFPDMQHMMQVGMQVLFYLTPIFYPAKLLEQHGLSLAVQLNPLAVCLELIRVPILYAEVPTWQAYATAAGAALGAASIAALVLKHIERRLIFFI